MNEIGSYLLFGAIAFLCGIGFSLSKADDRMRGECDRFGMVKLGDAYYTCGKRQ